MEDKEIFPQIVTTPKPLGRADYEKKCIFHERILYHYLKRKINGWGVQEFLNEQEIESYALYAVTDFTELFLADLDQINGEKDKVVICDRAAEAFPFGIWGRTVISPEELTNWYKKGDIKKVIIMSILHENEIFDELMRRGVLLNDIISFVSVVYS